MKPKASKQERERERERERESAKERQTDRQTAIETEGMKKLRPDAQGKEIEGKGL